METTPDETDRQFNVSPSKSLDPARKKTFKIISVKKGGTGSGDPVTDDADSVDGLDESQTEDLSSEFYDSSKATDLDFDIQDTPLTPDEVTSTTTIVMKQKPDQNSQSRFKVVKIETKEPFRRGKWLCYDFFDTAPAAVVTLNGSKATEDSIIQSVLSSPKSVHYVPDHDVNESSSNLIVAPVVAISPSSLPGQPMLTDMFFPIQPAPSSQTQSNMDRLPGVVAQYPQPIHMSVAGGPTPSSSFHNIAQPGNTTIVQSLPNTNVFPYAQNDPSSFFNGNNMDKTSQPISIPNPLLVGASGVGHNALQSMSNVDQELTSQPVNVTSPGAMPPPNQGHAVQQQFSNPGPIVGDPPPRGIDIAHGISSIGIHENGIDTAGAEDQMGPGMDESMSSVKTLEPGDAQDPARLEEAVETVCNELTDGNDDDATDENGGSTVAIDNKIEQAMDLVKRHLMYAVREEVEILKQQISEMVERNAQLEYENSVLRSEALPETLNKLVVPRTAAVTQAAGGPGQTQNVLLQQQSSIPATTMIGQPQQQQPPPQQQQTLPSGTTTPSLQQQQLPPQQQHQVPQQQQQQQQ